MIATLIISIITFLSITASILFFPTITIKEKRISLYWVIALLGAVLLISTLLVPIDVIYNKLTENSEVNPLKILVLFFSMTLLSIFLDEAGLFHYLANKALKIAKGNQFSLFIILYFLTAILTIFTSNDVVILTFTPFICFFCKNAKVKPIPYLVSEFASANTWSMMFIIGNPTNIYLATSAGVNFVDYFKVMALPTICCGIVEFLILLLLFHKSLKAPMDITIDDYKIEDKLELIFGVVHLLICLVLLVLSNYINFEMWLVSFSCALSLFLFILVSRLIRKKNLRKLPTTIKKLPWQLVPFILSMFVIVVSLEYQGVAKMIGDAFGDNLIILKYGTSSFIAANIINNIPMSILFSNLPLTLDGILYKQAIFSSIVGSNIGAFLTPLGALAGIMFTSLLDAYDVKYGFKEFIKYGLIISIPVMSVALVMLFVIL